MSQRDTLRDQSSSHLFAILEIPGRYSTRRSSLPPAPPLWLEDTVRSRLLAPEPPQSPSQIFTLDFLIFARAMMRESLVCLAMIIRSDRGRFPRVVQTQA